MNFNHVSVLLDECIENLNIDTDGIYVDGTLGGAGHSVEIAKRISQKGKLIGIDKDANAILFAQVILRKYTDRVILVRNDFSQIESVLDDQNIELVNGFLLDLGVSSHQLDEPSRGFSYMNDAKLDMRMDNRDGNSAYDVVNKYSQEDLNRIIFEYGEERWAKRISEFIVENRQIKPIETTFELVSIIKKAIPKGARQDGPHPAKRTFQAIRIEVNSELEILDQAIEDMANRLEAGGRICIITFHSLEDRIVKQAFRRLENPCTCPRDIPICVCNKKQVLKVVTRKPILPSEMELENNHRSRSAKLRVAERI